MDLTGVLGKRSRRAKPHQRRSRLKHERVSLSEAVRRIVVFLSRHRRQRVAVFCLSGRLLLASVAGEHYTRYLRCFPQSLVGIYDDGFDVDSLLDDLRDVGGLV